MVVAETRREKIKERWGGGRKVENRNQGTVHAEHFWLKRWLLPILVDIAKLPSKDAAITYSSTVGGFKTWPPILRYSCHGEVGVYVCSLGIWTSL